MPSEERGTLPVTIVGGYLGAGKTTLVNSLLRQANGRRLAVMVNEFGALPIDSDLIEAADDQIITLAGGCVCCSYGEDLVSSMAMLADLTPRPDHVLLEASGVAFPGAIAGTVGLLADFSLDGIVVLADAASIEARASDKYVGGTIRQQLQQADLLLLTKTDLAGEVQAVVDWIQKEVPDVRLIETRNGAIAIDVVLGLDHDPARQGEAPAHHADDYGTIEIRMGAPIEEPLLAAVLADPAYGLLRAKGYVRTGGGDRLVQVVGNRVSIRETEDRPQDYGLVCIGLKDRLDVRAVQTAIKNTEAAT